MATKNKLKDDYDKLCEDITDKIRKNEIAAK